jgi:hypothetical protein
MPSSVRIGRSEPVLEKPPVDRIAELHKRVSDIDDLVEPRPEQIVLSTLPPLLRPHRIALRPLMRAKESRPTGLRNLQDNDRSNRQIRQT